MNDQQEIPNSNNYQNEKDLFSKMFTYSMLLPFALYIMRHSLSRISAFFGSHIYEKISLIIFILGCIYFVLYYIIRKICKKVDIPIFIYSLNPKFVFNPAMQIFALTTFIILFIFLVMFLINTLSI